eukprot:SAG11_NODE_4249_length_1986_cov_2.119237_2_plen_135_part_00
MEENYWTPERDDERPSSWVIGSTRPRLQGSATLAVTVVQGLQITTAQSPFVELEVAGDRRKSRTHHGGGADPVYNETFVFDVVPAPNQKLRLTIGDEVRVSSTTPPPPSHPARVAATNELFTPPCRPKSLSLSI